MIKRDKLIAMCNEFSVLFDLKEPIDTNLSDKELHAQIKEAVELLEQDDDLSEETIEGLRTMGLFKKNVEKEEPVITLESQINEATKLKELRDIAKVNPEFKVIRGTLTKFTKVEQMKMTMLKMLESKSGKEEPVVKEKKAVEKTPLKVVTEVKKVVVKEEPKSKPIAKKEVEKEKVAKPIVKEVEKSASYYVRYFICENSEITTNEIKEKLKEIGLTLSIGSILTRKAEMTSTINIMKELNKLK